MRGKLLCQGAEAKIYEGEWLGKNALVKHRFSKTYRLAELDSHITKERLKNEARALTRCRMVGIRTPIVYDVDFITSELIMERVENSITVRNLMYKYAEDDICFDDEAVPMASQVKNLATKIGSVLSKLHKNNIIHGDLTTSNMLVVEPYDSSEIILIDFGMSSMVEKAEDKAVDLYVLERAILSAHPKSEGFVSILLEAYEKSGGRAAADTITKLNEVRLRGRKKLCFG
ncbi:hypothetical protein HAZT_HAZT000345 [Hyalella azteca]|nr:hypothetical protein HAZT_HAZT000345 [Hyalella azteca]